MLDQRLRRADAIKGKMTRDLTRTLPPTVSLQFLMGVTEGCSIENHYGGTEISCQNAQLFSRSLRLGVFDGASTPRSLRFSCQPRKCTRLPYARSAKERKGGE